MGKIPFVCALNKTDLAEQWETQPADESTLAARGWTVLRTSAKTGESVEDAFARLAQAMMGKQG
jgi:50S ribosomal subunit-associated GTPase HflX